MVTTSNFGKYYHGNLIERAQALVFALTGQLRQEGQRLRRLSRSSCTTGSRRFVTFSMLDLPAAAKLIWRARLLDDGPAASCAGYTDEMIAYERSRKQLRDGRMDVAARCSGTSTAACSRRARSSRSGTRT